MEGFLAFSAQQKAKCITWYHQTGSITQTQRNYRTTYAESPPARNSILRWVQNFDEHGRVGNAEASGRPGTSSNQEERVSKYFVRYPSRSLRRAEQDLNIPRSSIHDILRNRLHMFPYKLQVVQQLEDGDYTARIEFAQWCLQNIQGDSSFLNRVIYSDECVFHVDGKVNKHNVRIWGTENPHERREVARDSEKVTVWCAMSANQVFGPYYFDSPIVTGESYKQLLTNYFLPMLPSLPPDAIFQQDGAPPHYSLEVRQLLDEKLPDSWIGRGGPTRWPPRSPDLTPLDFFLWGYVKDKVYVTPCPNLTQLKRRITTAIRSVSVEMLLKVWENSQARLSTVIRENGGHFEHL